VQDGLDALDLNRPNGSVNYTYDTLNRVNSAATLGTACTMMAGGTLNWASTYTVDPWGNLTAKTPTLCTGETMTASTTNDRNQLASATYDSAGNVMQTNSVGFTYDAEGRITNGSGTVYTYDGMGERVAKAGSKLYWKGVGSTALVETNTSDTNPTRYIFFNGQRIARVDPGTTTAKYYVTDNVGSTALETDYLGNILNESLFFPYGVERVIEQSDTANNYKFTGKERDAETGLDDFGARYYDSNLGRFMTPDWDAKPTSVPYAKFGDPQTLNLYAYVENGPLNNVDADGHDSGGPDPIDPAHQPGPLCLTGVCIQLSGLSDATGKTSADEINYDAKVAEDQQEAAQQATQNDAAPQPAQQQNQSATPNPNGSVPAPAPGKGPGWKPGDPLTPNEWEPGKGSNSPDGRPTRWGPKYPIPGQSQPGTSWDEPNGHWDNDDGKGNRTRWLPNGGGQVDHDNNPTTRNVVRGAAAGAAAIGTGYIIYRIIRMLPSLAPPLWPTIPANAIIP
jgi:RHS repeat-associated protein